VCLAACGLVGSALRGEGELAVQLNGEELVLPEGLTIAGLIGRLGLPRDGIAVAVDMKVVPRGEHGAWRLESGQKIELIHAVGGG